MAHPEAMASLMRARPTTPDIPSLRKLVDSTLRQVSMVEMAKYTELAEEVGQRPRLEDNCPARALVRWDRQKSGDVLVLAKAVSLKSLCQ